jgi:hypothetical protein
MGGIISIRRNKMIKKAPIRSNQLIKRSDYIGYFQYLENSPTVKGLQKKTLKKAAEIDSTDGEALVPYIEEIKVIEKDTEKERAKINDTLKEIKALNQGIYQTIIDKAKKLKAAAQGKYNAWVREESRKKRELQDKLDREAEAARLKLETERKEAKDNGAPLPPEIIIPTPTVRDVVMSKTIARKRVEVIIDNKDEFIRDAAKRNDPELLDCIDIVKTTGIVNKAKRNPGKDTYAGVRIIYYPTDEAWGIRWPTHHTRRDGVPNYKRIDQGGPA